MSFHWTLCIKKQNKNISKPSQVLTYVLTLHQPLWETTNCLPPPAAVSRMGSIGLSMLSVTAKTPLCICFVYWGEGVFYIYILGGVVGGMEKYSIDLSQNNVCKSPWSIWCVSARVWVRAWECLTSLIPFCVMKTCEFYLLLLLFCFFSFPAEAIVNKQKIIVNKSYVTFFFLFKPWTSCHSKPWIMALKVEKEETPGRALGLWLSAKHRLIYGMQQILVPSICSPMFELF